MKWLDSLKVKPWLQPKKRPELMPISGVRATSGHMIGLVIFLMVAGALFTLFIVSYQYRMAYQDWRPAPEPWQLWMNTLFLLIGSLAFQIASNKANDGDYQRVKQILNIAGVFTCLFLLGQAWAWSVMQTGGYNVKVNPANSFFYLITGVHAVHIIGGLVAWFKAVRRVQNKGYWREIQLSVKLCAVYWHFLLIVWLVLFYMLLVT